MSVIDEIAAERRKQIEDLIATIKNSYLTTSRAEAREEAIILLLNLELERLYSTAAAPEGNATQ